VTLLDEDSTFLNCLTSV